jgi:cytoskeletal protein CcmA (bactofilin family)
MERFSYSRDSSARRAEDDTRAEAADWSSSRAAAPAADEAAAPQLSVLGKSLVFKGELTANEDLLIQGRVDGSITHTASTLTIGAHGDVKADITARRVIVQGKLEGDIRASESVVVEVSANVRGNIVAPRVTLKDGAKFRGSIDMEMEDSAAETQRAANPTGKRGKEKAASADARVEELLA